MSFRRGFQNKASYDIRKKTDAYNLGYSWAGKIRIINKFILQRSTWIILVYDVTRRETFTSLLKTWAKELERCCTNPDCIKILVGNKVDRDNERAVTAEEGIALAQENMCLFFECSAKTQLNVKQCFKELTLKILEVPSLVEKGSTPVKNQILKQKAHHKDNCRS